MALTQNTYTGNGSTVLFSFTFPYLDTSDIRVSVNDVDTTAYTQENATTIRFNTAPVNGANIRIYRRTDSSALPATFYPGSAIRAQDLNDDFTQTLYVVQESVNAIDGAVQRSEAAMLAAGDAVVEAGEAKAIAEGAALVAISADQKATTSLQEAAQAVGTANSATSTANTANSKADSAIAAVNAAALFTPVTNVASIPSNPTNQQGISVTDSTGIEGFTPLFGLPAGFIGDAGKAVRIVYNTAAGTWFWYGYSINDPDDRYMQIGGGIFSGPVYLPSGSVVVGYQTTADMASYLTVSDAASTYLTQTNAGATYQPLSGMSAYAKLAATQTFTKAQRGAPVALTDQAIVVADFAAGNYFTLTLGGNRQLGVPTNLTAGQSGVIVVTNGGTHTLSFASVWKFSGGTAPTVTANGVDVLAYYVESGSRITTRFIGDVK